LTTANSGGAAVEPDKKALRKMFPNLSRELGSEENKVSVNSVRTDNETGEKRVTQGRFVHYVPDVIDFIRRCDTPEQAEEIIAYMEKRGEIDGQYAQRLRKQLKEKGVRSFGAKKEHDYYLKHGEL
jgi:hypothetical protein